MSTLSKLVHLPPLFNQRLNHLQLDLNTNLTHLLLLAGGKNSAVIIVRHGGHERIFRRRQGQLINNRIKDIWHFYYVALGIVPCLILTTLTHIFFGSSCELMEYPKEGEKPPHHWQFERTPIRQFYSKYIFPTDIQYHEGWCSRFSNWQIKDRWRRIEQRVKHLIRERQDYKAYHYHPVSVEWQDLARRRAWRAQNSYFEAESVVGTDAR